MKNFKILLCILTVSVLSTVTYSKSKSKDGALNASLLKTYEQDFDANHNDKRIINAITNNDIKQLSLNREKLLNRDKIFNVKLKTNEITNQKNSGRCWMFAGVNILSPKVMTKLNISNFELSEPYITFWDKLEKANFFLERIIEMRDRPLDDRSLSGELEYFFGDGGWWQYLSDLITKYGVVPLSVMPETKQSTTTYNYTKLGRTILRKDAAELRQMYKDGKSVKQLRARKEKMLAEIYDLLVYAYGKPPKEFTFRYERKNDDTTSKAKSKTEIIEKKYTPQSFFKEFYADEIPEFVAIVNNPTKDYDQMYQIEASRNIYERPDISLLNLPIDKLKEYALKSLLDSQAVWFACDVGKENYNDSGIFRVNIYDYNTTLNMNFNMSKKNRIAFQEISPNHAMVFTGVDTSSTGVPVKWLVKNSWGTKRGHKGYWTMYDDWFNQYVLMVIVDKRLLSKEDVAKLKQKPKKIADWEPFFFYLRNLD